MRVVLSWLCDFADFYSLADRGSPIYMDQLAGILADAMNSRGLVVEGVEKTGFGLEGVVVAKVVEVAAIPGADRIRKVLVDAGGDSLEQIVCGAFNFGVGDHVPLARVGTVLPGDFAISARKMKGVESNGMLCSARELAMGTDYDGLMILDGQSAPGSPLAESLGVVPDVVFDLAIEANRPDANCHMGVARELAVHFSLEFSLPKTMDLSEVAVEALAPSLIASDGCDALMLARFDDVMAAKVPDFVPRRLALAEMRSISPVVDASNYVMLELGQPTHPYDLSKLGGEVVGVREAFQGEELVTLDGNRRTLGISKSSGAPVADLVIVNSNDTPIGLAGIMGGASSEIAPATTSILLELAHFRADLIAKTSKRLSLRSEASARFERGVDPAIAPIALERFCALVGLVPSAIGAYSNLGEAQRVTLRTARIEALLGDRLPMDSLVGDLAKMGFIAQVKDHGVIDFEIPSNRPDVVAEVDLIEEFARHYGYANISRRKLMVPTVGRLSAVQKRRRSIIEFSVARGYFEAWTSSLLGPNEQERLGDLEDKITISNPMALEESILRRSLLPGLLRATVANLRRRESRVGLFEIGKVFSHSGQASGFPAESERAAWIYYREGAPVLSPYELLADLFSRFGLSLGDLWTLARISEVSPEAMAKAGFSGLHPNNSLAILRDGRPVGQLGEPNPFLVREVLGETPRGELSYLELDLGETLFESAPSVSAVTVSVYPHAEFDLSFAVPLDALAVTLAKAAEGALEGYEARITLIDDYRGADLKDAARSLTFRFWLAARDHTLSDAEIRELRGKAISALTGVSGATLRA